MLHSKVGARVSEGPPGRGSLMRDFALAAADGRQVSLSDFRGRRDLVVLFCDGREDLLAPFIAKREAFSAEQAQVIAIVRGTVEHAKTLAEQLRWPYPLLADPDGEVHRHFGAEDAPAAYVTDRYAEVYAAFREGEGQPIPSPDELLKWLEFVNVQCPECEPTEWPAP